MTRAMTRAALAALLSCAAALASPAAAEPARWGADYFPNVPLVTQDGKTVRFYDDLLKDKIVAIDLVYTHCRFVCPLESARLAQVQRLLGDRVGKDIFFYSITIDPARDTPEVLKAYAERFHAGPGWTFLTGKMEDIKLVAKKLGLSFQPDPKNKDGHTAELMVGNVAAGQWMRNSAVDNPRFLATMIGNFISGWKNRAAASQRSYAEARPIELDSKGQYLFSTRCAACHTIGQGDRVGPDLAGVTRARERSWLTRYIAAPERVLAEGDPTARALDARYKHVRMPNLGLGAPDVAALVDYLDAQGRRQPSATAARTIAGTSLSNAARGTR